MSLAESFLETAKSVLMMSENIKRLDERVNRIADDVYGLDRRIMRLEIVADLARQNPRKRAPKELPGQ
jgi:hypothetical protein